ncbi:MAG: hypothetical protein R6V60_13770 [Desulfobacterales bacterium]
MKPRNASAAKAASNCVRRCSVSTAEAEKAYVIMPEGGDEACIDEAIDTCPVECIHWE